MEMGWTQGWGWRWDEMGMGREQTLIHPSRSIPLSCWAPPLLSSLCPTAGARCRRQSREMMAARPLPAGITCNYPADRDAALQ